MGSKKDSNVQTEARWYQTLDEYQYVNSDHVSQQNQVSSFTP